MSQVESARNWHPFIAVVNDWQNLSKKDVHNEPRNLNVRNSTGKIWSRNTVWAQFPTTHLPEEPIHNELIEREALSTSKSTQNVH